LSRKPGNYQGITAYGWSPKEGKIDAEALKTATHIVSLSGESIAGEKWTEDYKNKIIQSRRDAASTLINALKNNENHVEAIVAASAIGYYGSRNNELLNEESGKGSGFLADTTVQWEEAYADVTCRLAQIRIGIVLDANGGALPKMRQPLHFGIAPIVGSGKQFMSWIHLDDLCGIFQTALVDEKFTGIYNAVSPHPAMHRDFMMTLRNVVAPNAIPLLTPTFLLKLVLGEQTTLLTDSANVDAQKIQKLGYRFQFSELENALRNIYGK
jgi:hypothetical protein